MTQDDLILKLRQLLRAALDARFSAEPQDHKVRAQAYADGYMRALADTQRLDDKELLSLVTDERRRHCGDERAA